MSKTRTKKITPHTLTPWQNDATYKYYEKHVIRHNGLVIAIICHGDGVDDAEAEANARLIVAAPSLLEACKSVREWLLDTKQIPDNGISHPAFVKANNLVTAVIALSEVTR